MANPYRIQLINDLHNHFPELLYNYERFESTLDVLQYVANIARDSSNHVNPYPYYHDQYQSNVVHQPQYDEIYNDNVLPLRHRLERRRYNPIQRPALRHSPERPVHRSPERPVHHSPERPVISFRYISLGDDLDIENIVRNMISEPIETRLINLPRNSGMNSQFSEQIIDYLHELLEDVPVIPSEEQIRTNTTLKTLDEDISDNCAVCQDQLKKEQEARTINHCSHMFHRECIDRWFETNVQCPCCRYDIRGL